MRTTTPRAPRRIHAQRTTTIRFVIAALLLLGSSERIMGQDPVAHEELAPSLFNLDHTTYHQGTARQMAALAELVYWEGPEQDAFFTGMQRIHPELPWEYRHLADRRSDAQALLVRYPDRLVIAFRGTQFSVLKDLVNDVKFWTYENSPSASERIRGLPPGHGGFRRSVMALILRQGLLEVVDTLIRNAGGDVRTFPIYLTGHSLGAAMGAMFCSVLEAQGYTMAGAYFFAPPLALRPAEACRLSKRYGTVVHEIINYKDYVPRALATNRCRYRHFGLFYRFDVDGTLRQEPEMYVRMGRGERKVVAYHRLLAHREALKLPGNTAEAVRARQGQLTFPNNSPVDRGCGP